MQSVAVSACIPYTLTCFLVSSTIWTKILEGSTAQMSKTELKPLSLTFCVLIHFDRAMPYLVEGHEKNGDEG